MGKDDGYLIEFENAKEAEDNEGIGMLQNRFLNSEEEVNITKKLSSPGMLKKQESFALVERYLLLLSNVTTP